MCEQGKPHALSITLTYPDQHGFTQTYVFSGSYFFMLLLRKPNRPESQHKRREKGYGQEDAWSWQAQQSAAAAASAALASRHTQGPTQSTP